MIIKNLFLGSQHLKIKSIYKNPLLETDKPLLSDAALAVGLEKHENKYMSYPGDPLNTKHINETYKPQGKGTKQDPFIIPSHEKTRLCKVDLGSFSYFVRVYFNL